MKAHKRAIKFFEKYDIEAADRMLFELFTDWVKAVNPSIEIERTVYGHVADMRSFFWNVWRMVESGKSSEVGYYLLLECDKKNWKKLLRKILSDLSRKTKPRKELVKIIGQLISDIIVA